MASSQTPSRRLCKPFVPFTRATGRTRTRRAECVLAARVRTLAPPNLGRADGPPPRLWPSAARRRLQPAGGAPYDEARVA